MFFEIGMKRIVVLGRWEINRRALALRLLKDLADLKCSREHGYYVCPTKLKRVSLVSVTTGYAAFTVEFGCMVFKLFKHEVVELEVVKVTRWGVKTTCGPYGSIFLHVKYMGGFEFCKADREIDDCFRGLGDSVIKIGTLVRARIMGIRLLEELERHFQALATINGDFLGVVADARQNAEPARV